MRGIITIVVQGKVEESLKSFPVVGIFGPRQVGKTTLAKEIQKKFNACFYRTGAWAEVDLVLVNDYLPN